jgi:biotin carboxyl carrier protein
MDRRRDPQVKRTPVPADVAGTVWQIVVAAGDTVAAEQELVVLESMKMEIPALAPHAGVVREILVTQGEAVAEGQVLLIIDAG